jgi:hypothetical protein
MTKVLRLVVLVALCVAPRLYADNVTATDDVTTGVIVRASASANPSTLSASAMAADDNMHLYRQLAADTLAAFQAHDMSTARKKARELEVTWDSREKVLQKKSPDLWGQIDKAMDAFIKPVMKDKAPDPATVQTAYDTYISKLQLAEPTN